MSLEATLYPGSEIGIAFGRFRTIKRRISCICLTQDRVRDDAYVYYTCDTSYTIRSVIHSSSIWPHLGYIILSALFLFPPSSPISHCNWYPPLMSSPNTNSPICELRSPTEPPIDLVNVYLWEWIYMTHQRDLGKRGRAGRRVWL